MWKSSRILKGIFVFLAVILLSSPALSAKRSSTEQYLQELHAQGKEKVIVTFKKEIQPSIVEKYGQVLKTLKIINGVVAIIDKDNITALKNESGIKNVAIDAVISIPRFPPRQLFIRPASIFETLDSNSIIVGWNLQEPGLNVSNTPPPPSEPNTYGAWSVYSVSGLGIIIAIMDTGVNYTLEDLGGPKYLGGYDFINDDNDPLDDNISTHGHGTIVATVALAQGTEKIKGVAPNASYYALKVLASDGSGEFSYTFEALDWCVNTANPKPDIVNMSFGIDPYDPYWTPEIETLYRNAVNAAYDAGIILVAGSGNAFREYSYYPARFENVISVGGHTQDQVLYYRSNGSVDVLAPGEDVPSMDMIGDVTHLYSGTSMATPHAAGLIALQLQYARQHDLQPNNGYLWEVMKHAARPLTGEAYDPIYQGSGKVFAARTDANDANIGSIDLMAANWPISHDFNFCDYAFTEPNYPVYLTGTDINQTITLTNITDVLGNAVETIENLAVTATHIYCDEPNEPNLPGDSNITFPVITLLEPNEANSITLNWVYTLPANATPGLVKTKLALEFNFAGNPRIITITFSEPNSFWYAAIPADLDLSNTVDFLDFSKFSTYWQQTECNESNNWCNRADINQSSAVDLSDLAILADNWLRGL